MRPEDSTMYPSSNLNINLSITFSQFDFDSALRAYRHNPRCLRREHRKKKNEQILLLCILTQFYCSCLNLKKNRAKGRGASDFEVQA